jgi:hypothetical protein
MAEKLLPRGEENFIRHNFPIDKVRGNVTVIGLGEKVGFIKKLSDQGTIFNCSDKTASMLQEKHGIIFPPKSQPIE